MEITESATITPEDSQYLFVPAKKAILAEGIQTGHIEPSALERATFDYETARKTAAAMVPTSKVVVDTPFEAQVVFGIIIERRKGKGKSPEALLGFETGEKKWMQTQYLDRPTEYISVALIPFYLVSYRF